MKWERTYPPNYPYDGRIKYVCGEYSIMKSNYTNWFTGMPVKEQVWQIFKLGEKVASKSTLKDAKAIVERTRNKRL